MKIALILNDKDLEMLPWKNFGYQNQDNLKKLLWFSINSILSHISTVL